MVGLTPGLVPPEASCAGIRCDDDFSSDAAESPRADDQDVSVSTHDERSEDALARALTARHEAKVIESALWPSTEHVMNYLCRIRGKYENACERERAIRVVVSNADTCVRLIKQQKRKASEAVSAASATPGGAGGNLHADLHRATKRYAQEKSGLVRAEKSLATATSLRQQLKKRYRAATSDFATHLPVYLGDLQRLISARDLVDSLRQSE